MWNNVPEDDETNWESSAWNFNSDYYKRRQQQAAEMRKAYDERQARSAKHPPDEDEWNK